MSTAAVTTDINIGPFKIPSNGQGMIINNYANRNNLLIDLTIPEPMSSNALATVQWMKKKYKIKKIILCSIYQLPFKNKECKIFISSMQNVEFHFALEGIKGKGKNFLLQSIKEANIFRKSQIINSKENDWIDLYNLIQRKK